MRSRGSACLDATIAKSSEKADDPGPATPAHAQPAEDEAARATAAELVRSLLALGAVWPGDEHTRRRLVHASVDHGIMRRGQGEGEAVIFSDYDRLRGTVWGQLRRTALPPGQASQTIVGIDAAISLAVAGSLRGFYRDVIERAGEWPRVVERLVWEWRHHANPQGR